MPRVQVVEIVDEQQLLLSRDSRGVLRLLLLLLQMKQLVLAPLQLQQTMLGKQLLLLVGGIRCLTFVLLLLSEGWGVRLLLL